VTPSNQARPLACSKTGARAFPGRFCIIRAAGSRRARWPPFSRSWLIGEKMREGESGPATIPRLHNRQQFLTLLHVAIRLGCLRRQEGIDLRHPGKATLRPGGLVRPERRPQIEPDRGGSTASKLGRQGLTSCNFCRNLCRWLTRKFHAFPTPQMPQALAHRKYLTPSTKSWNFGQFPQRVNQPCRE
jgi:hypothetical protein